MSGVRYSLLSYVLLMVVAAPLIVAIQSFAPIDWSPWLLMLAVGIGLVWLLRSVLARVQATVHRGAAALTAGEVAPKHAPGGWFVWVAVPAWTIGLGLGLNVLLDSSLPEEHLRPVVQVTTGKGARVILRDYRPGGGTLSIRRDDALVRGLREGQDVIIVVRRGFFGWAWIASIRKPS